MKRLAVVAALVVISAVNLAASLAGLALVQPAAADRLDNVKSHGKLVGGVSDTTPPFSFKKPGESAVIGYDLDVVHTVAKRLDVETSGDAAKIFDAWFGPQSQEPMTRNFKIQAD